MLENEIKKNIEEINSRISEVAKRSNRERSEIKLVAVTKKFPVVSILSALSFGQKVFGENYVQEARSKMEELSKFQLEFQPQFHFIGHLQRNKAKDVVGKFSLIETVDSLRLAQEISKEAVKQGIVQSILIQVNISEESTKSGVGALELKELVSEVIKLPGIKLLGLMSIGAFVEEIREEGKKLEFQRMRELRDDLEQSLAVDLPELSMGMTDDFELAIEEGATIIRVGSAIFGERA
jgi:PLP dependent protein